MSTTQVNKLGERLRAGPISEADLLALDDFRRQFADASAEVERVLRDEFRQHPASREAKSTPAICAKLQRERGSRLASMQDIAGCRVVVANRQVQRTLVEALTRRFEDCKLIDRIAQPSHGYRALHVVVCVQGRRVEIQVRTELQHLWAQLCELLADRVGLAFKYGEGHPVLRGWMDQLSAAVNALEQVDSPPDAPPMKATVKMMPDGPQVDFGGDELAEWLQTLVRDLPDLLGDST